MSAGTDNSFTIREDLFQIILQGEQDALKTSGRIQHGVRI